MVRKALLAGFLGIFAFCLSYSCNFGGDDQQEAGEKKNLKLAVFGDSIAVGLFSDSELGGSPSIDHPLVKIANASSNKAESSQNINDYYRKKVENSFTCPLADCQFSLAKQLAITAAESFSYATIGARYSAKEQAVTISQQIAKFNGSAEIYVLEGGANDFCASDYDHGKVEQAVKQAITEVYQKNAEAKVIVIPVPNILRVFEIAADDEIAIKLDSEEITLSKTCKDLRKNSCHRLADATAEELQKLNAAITAVVKQFKDNGKKIAVADDVAKFAFDKEHIAADCFHPSRKGLEKISEFTKQAYDSLE